MLGSTILLLPLLATAALAIDVAVNAGLAGYPECDSDGFNNARSKVAIRVGDPGFFYTICGFTNSLQKVAVAGNYFNDVNTANGFANLYAIVDTGIVYRKFTSTQTFLDIDAENSRKDQFYFRVITPRYVTPYDTLRYGQQNATHIFVNGPSKNGRY